MSDFSAQGLATSAWALATAQQSDAKLFEMLALTAQRRIEGFSEQDLANTA